MNINGVQTCKACIKTNKPKGAKGKPKLRETGRGCELPLREVILGGITIGWSQALLPGAPQHLGVLHKASPRRVCLLPREGIASTRPQNGLFLCPHSPAKGLTQVIEAKQTFLTEAQSVGRLTMTQICD